MGGANFFPSKVVTDIKKDPVPVIFVILVYVFIKIKGIDDIFI